MKTKKLIEKMKGLLSASRRKQIAKYDSLEKVLEKLEAKDVTFREELAAEVGEERRTKLVHKLEVIEAQREKGMKLKAELDEVREVESD